MFEGLIQLQLPFILISSGISSGLYLLFLFFNIGQATTEQPHSKIDRESFTIEITTDDQSKQTANLFDYYSYTTLNLSNNHITPEPQIIESSPIKCRSFWRPYSFQFAQASFSRPPPSC